MVRLKKISAKATLLAAMCAFALPALAEEFTFNVPVSMAAIHEDVDKAAVQCRVCVGECSVTNIVGSGRVDINPSTFSSGQSSTRTITVRFDSRPNFSASDATHYLCFLELGKAGQGTAPTRDASASVSASTRHLTAKAGTAHVNPVSGPIPQ